MKFSMPSFRNLLYERDSSGDHIYYVDEEGGWETGAGKNLLIAQKHPILTPALLFVAKLFSQADFKIVNEKTGEVTTDHWLLTLLDSPNEYQSRMDMLESILFMMIAEGTTVLQKKYVVGFEDEPDELIPLSISKIHFPSNFEKKTAFDKDPGKAKVIYDKGGVDEEEIRIKDLMFFYDLPNMMGAKNKFKSKSRIDGLDQTLRNTKDSLLAKNIILKTNGKELITGKKGAFPLQDKEKKQAQRLFNLNYGLGKGRSRSLITKAELNWKSMHIALRDLGLDESVKVDGNIIYTALHIPKDILSLEAKKTTYNNFKESMVSYIQNEQIPTLNAFCLPFNEMLGDDLKLVGSYDHLPIMQFILLERYDGLKKQGEALQTFLNAGVPEELALSMCDFPVGTKLKKVKKDNSDGKGKKGKNKKHLQTGVRFLDRKAE